MNGLMRFLIRLLARCYPRAWRRRYGAEFAALLAQLPPTPSSMADTLRGAFDAHRQHGALSALDTQALSTDERRFWRRWVLALGTIGVILGIAHRLVPVALVSSGQFGSNMGVLFTIRLLIMMPVLAAIALGLGIWQRQIMRSLFPVISHWWSANLPIGSLLALMALGIDHSYRLFPDFLSMTRFVITLLSLGSETVQPTRTGYDFVAVYLVPVMLFSGIAATLQAYALQGTIRRSGWWIAISPLAAIAGMGVARLCVLLRPPPAPLMPVPRYDLVAIDIAITTAQFGLACAVYGIVSGAGLLLLRRPRETPQTSPTADVA